MEIAIIQEHLEVGEVRVLGEDLEDLVRLREDLARHRVDLVRAQEEAGCCHQVEEVF